MTEHSNCIFVVDDDDDMRLQLCEQLKELGYPILDFAEGSACLAKLDLNPDLILLDIHLPDQSGLELCREIRQQGYDEVQVMLVSAYDDLDTLLAFFDVGGNDYVLKGVPQDVLLRKIVVAIENQQSKSQLKSQLSYARQTAFTAMSSLGETGVVLEFMRSSFHCLSFQHLGELLLSTLQQFEVKGMIKLTDAEQTYYFGSDLVCSALETSILNYVEKFNRVYQANDRLAFNFPYITLLVVGLNIEDVEGVGRLRDHLAIIVEAAGVRIDAMRIEQQNLRSAQKSIASIGEQVELLEQIEINQHANRYELENLLEVYRHNLDNAVSELGFTDIQELSLHQINDKFTQKMNLLFEKDTRLALDLTEVVQKQKALLVL